MTQPPPFPVTGTWAEVAGGTESASTSPCWTPLLTATDAPAPSAPAPPPAPPPVAGSAPPPAVTRCWWRRRSWTRPQSTLGSRHPRGPLPLGVKSVETPPLPPPVLHGGAVTQRTCKDATSRVETLRHKLHPAAVSSASHRKPGRRHWNRYTSAPY